jgi:hypothetical protein
MILENLHISSYSTLSMVTVQEYIKSALMKSIVWPRRFVFPIIPGEDFR